MAKHNPDFVSVNLKLSAALYAQIVMIAKAASKDVEPTMKNLLWIAVGQMNLQAKKGRSGS